MVAKRRLILDYAYLVVGNKNLPAWTQSFPKLSVI
jgi:hypothetical protein